MVFPNSSFMAIWIGFCFFSNKNRCSVLIVDKINRMEHHQQIFNQPHSTLQYKRKRKTSVESDDLLEKCTKSTGSCPSLTVSIQKNNFSNDTKKTIKHFLSAKSSVLVPESKFRQKDVHEYLSVPSNKYQENAVGSNHTEIKDNDSKTPPFNDFNNTKLDAPKVSEHQKQGGLDSEIGLVAPCNPYKDRHLIRLNDVPFLSERNGSDYLLQSVFISISRFPHFASFLNDLIDGGKVLCSRILLTTLRFLMRIGEFDFLSSEKLEQSQIDHLFGELASVILDLKESDNPDFDKFMKCMIKTEGMYYLETLVSSTDWPTKIQGGVRKGCAICHFKGMKFFKTFFGSIILERNQVQVEKQISSAFDPKKKQIFEQSCKCSLDNDSITKALLDKNFPIEYGRFYTSAPPVLVIRYHSIGSPHSSPVELPLTLSILSFVYILRSFIIETGNRFASVICKESMWYYCNNDGIYSVNDIRKFLNENRQFLAAFYEKQQPSS